MEKTKKQQIILWSIFAVYSLVTLICVLRHEMWLDEAQAWVIVRDTPLAEIPKVLNTEGHPPLWYAILYPFVKLGFPVEYGALISWVFAVLGALVLLFKVKLPIPLKGAMLFSAGGLFFSSVMLRSYCLIPLLLFAIMWIYPNRRKHPLLYGLLIALLANTHVFICGIVGVLGIYMVYDLFSQWKKSDKKENIKQLAGLAIAGAGVLTLVIPLIGSVHNNSAVEQRTYNITSLSFFGYTTDNFKNYFNLVGSNIIAWLPVFSIMTVACIVMLILLRHYPRAFFVQLGFVLFHFITCYVLWFSMPSRSAIFMLSFGFSLCLAQFEEAKFKDYKISDEIHGILRKFVEMLKKADLNAPKVYTAILTVCLAVSAPSGIKLLCKDIAGDFSGSKDTAEYIKNNFDEDALFVTTSPGMPEISAYYPEFKQFSLCTGQNSSYMIPNKSDYGPDEIIEKLSGYDKIYFFDYDEDHYLRQEGKVNANGVIYFSEDGAEYDFPKTFFVIKKYDPEEVERYVVEQSRNYEKQKDLN